MKRATLLMSVALVVVLASACGEKRSDAPKAEPPNVAVAPAQEKAPEEPAAPAEPKEAPGGSDGQIRVALSIIYGDQQPLVRELLDGKLPEFRECHDAQRQAEGIDRVEGRVRFLAKLKPDGTFETPEITLDQTGHPEIGNCIAEKMGGWRMPAQFTDNHPSLKYTVSFGH